MAAEIANRQLLSIAQEIVAEGDTWEDFLAAENIPFVALEDQFARLAWSHYVDVMDAAARRWGLEHLADIALRSVSDEAVASFRDGITMQCDSLDEMMAYLFSADGAFRSILPCVEYSFEKLGRRHWRVDVTMVPGYELSAAHCHFGIGVLRALPPLLFENEAQVTLTMAENRAHYDFRVPGWRPLAHLRLRHARSKPNAGLAQRVGETFTELMIRQVRLQAEAERRVEVEAELAHLEKLDALGRLTGSVAHDFNNMLTVIQGQLELLGMDLEDKDLIERVKLANRAADRGANLTRQLLAFGRRSTLQPELVDVNGVIESMLSMFSSTFGEIVEVHTKLAADLSNTLVDRSQLETALLNVAINARDAMPNGGELTLETSSIVVDEASELTGDVTPGRYVLVSMTDTGKGISADVLERVFEPFFSTKDPGLGTGLGLSMVWGFLKQSGGAAKIHSTAGKGTTVNLYFPEDTSAGASSRNPQEGTKAAGPVAATPGLRVLLIEDEEDVRKVVNDMLSQLGYEVHAAADADAALASLQQDRNFALLLSDVVLPGGMSGPELAQAVHATLPGLPVVYMSGYPDLGADNRAAIGPSDVLLPKPFSRADLSRTLHQVLDIPQASGSS